MAPPKAHHIATASSTSSTPLTPPTLTHAIASKSLPVTKDSYPVRIENEERITMPQRVAAYLHGVAEKWPYQLIRYDEIYRQVHHLPRKGTIGITDLKRIRGLVTASKRWLAEYGRTVVLGEMGARASVDDQDIVESVMPKRVGRLMSSIKAAQETDALVNTREISGEMGAWYKKSFKPALSTLEKVRDTLIESAPEAKALPPKK